MSGSRLFLTLFSFRKFLCNNWIFYTRPIFLLFSKFVFRWNNLSYLIIQAYLYINELKINLNSKTILVSFSNLSLQIDTFLIIFLSHLVTSMWDINKLMFLFLVKIQKLFKFTVISVILSILLTTHVFLFI